MSDELIALIVIISGGACFLVMFASVALLSGHITPKKNKGKGE